MADQEPSKSSKVLIFTAPILCSECIHKGPNVAHEGNNVCWRKSTLQLTGNSFVPFDQQSSNNRGNELTEESDIRLEYEPLAIQKSVCFYLESEFKNTENSSQATKDTESSFGFETGLNTAGENASNENVQREFEDIRCTSQRLLIENGAQSSSVSSDKDKRGTKRKNKKLSDFDGDTNAHQLTVEDIYTQDKCLSSSSSNTCSPIHKRAARSKNINCQVSSCVSAKSFNGPHELGNPFFCNNYYLTVPKVWDKLIALKDCTTENSLVNILFVVIQVNDTREVQIKSGISAGSFVPVSSLLVADESKSCFKLTLWREASRWTEKITPGDFAVATSIKVGKWREEYVGQTSFNSGFYNLHQPKTLLSSICLKLVSQKRLNTLARWVQTEHPYFFASSRVKRNVEFTEIPQLRDSTLVHFRGKLISIHRTSPASSTYHFGGQQLTRITAVLAERPGDEIQLFLWGKQAAWMNQLQEGLGRVWEFQYLTAKYNTDTGCASLHTTPRSIKAKLSLEDKNACFVMSRFDEGAKQARQFANLREFLEAKYTGLAQLEAGITSLQFNCESEVIIVDQTEPATDRLKEKIDKLVYIGCGSCARALVQDENGVYCQCSHCVATNPNHQYTISYHYKPLTMLLGDSHVSLQVEAFSRVISRLFHDFPAKTLAQRTANELSHDKSFVDSFVRYTKALVKGDTRKMLVACHVTLDENSFIENRTLTLQEIDVP